MRPSPFLKIKQREPSGRHQRERVSDIIATATRNRIRMGVHPKEVRNQLAGFAFGRLCLQKIITQEQYEAGCNFGRIVVTYARIMGVPSANPRSISMIMIGGIDHSEPLTDPERIAKARRSYEDMFSALNDASDGKRYLNALKECILQDQSTDIGDLRCGLNVLCHLWR
ncbi:hypothetical protein [Labrys neptuniae]